MRNSKPSMKTYYYITRDLIWLNDKTWWLDIKKSQKETVQNGIYQDYIHVLFTFMECNTKNGVSCLWDHLRVQICTTLENEMRSQLKLLHGKTIRKKKTLWQWYSPSKNDSMKYRPFL